MKTKKNMDTHLQDENEPVKKLRKLNDESHFSSGSSNPNVFQISHSSNSDEQRRSVENLNNDLTHIDV
jgi:hypothetical protein